MNVALGGTFDPIHDGHRALFDRAFELGAVTVGLTSDELAPKTRHTEREIQPFEQRRAALANELETFAERHNREFEIRRLEEPTGIATEPKFDALIVSPETKPVAGKINDIRTGKGLDPLQIEVVDHVFADDGEIISSTRILAGEIDEHGNVVADRD